MARIPLNYPTDSSNEKIIEVINELSREIIDSGANINLHKFRYLLDSMKESNELPL